MFAITQTSSEQIDSISSNTGIKLNSDFDFLQPALAGTIAAAGSYFFIDKYNRIPLFGVQLPSYLFYGVTTAAASFIQSNLLDSITKMIVSALTDYQFVADIATATNYLAEPLVVSGVNVGLNYFLNRSASYSENKKLFMVSFGSVIASEWLKNVL